MKWGSHPGKSSVHRYTCLSLYRALLRQCSKLPSTINENDTTRKAVREQFDKYKLLNSPSRTIHSLEAGYEALDMIYSASQGDTNSIHRISKLLEDIKPRKPRETRKPPQKATVSTRLSPQQKKRAENIAQQKQTLFRHPDAEPILSRPRAVVAGQRKIPILVNARGVPFLRIKKPQPQNLSRVLRQLQERKIKLTDRYQRLQVETLFAKDEENWDRIINGETPLEITDESSIKGSWAQSARDARAKANRENLEFQEKQLKLAEKMWEVVQAERKLAEKEEAQREKRELPP